MTAADDVRVLRRAARRAVEADLSNLDRCRVIVELAHRARSSEWPWAAQTAVWAEVRDFLAEGSGEAWMATPNAAPRAPSLPMERAIRSLRGRGYVRCPECRQALPDEPTMDRWVQLRLDLVEEMRRREAIHA